MDSKSDDTKRPSTSVAYVRSFDDVSKKRSCFSSLLKCKTSCITFLFSILLLGCFIIMLLYVNLKADNQRQWFTGQFPINTEPSEIDGDDSQAILQFSRHINPNIKNDIFELIDDESLVWPDLDLMPSNIEKYRSKRQVPGNIPDCRGKQEECKIILKSVKGLTREVHRRLDRMQKELAAQGLYNENESTNAKFRKIYECLQCRNAIAHNAEDDGLDAILPGVARQDQAMTELMPFFEHKAYKEENGDDSEAELKNGEERTDRVAKAPGQQQIMESVKNNSKIVNNYKITEILKNTTIIEKDEPEKNELPAASQQAQLSPGIQKYTFMQYPGQAPQPGESHVTRNMGATAPIILPTVETTKTSQQIQFTPQSNWPSVPVCFYGTPTSASASSASLSAQPSSNAQYFIPYGLPPQGFGPTQQNRFFPTNNQQQQQQQQSYASANYQTQTPYQMNPLQSPSAVPSSPFTQGVMMGADQRHLPYYCTLMPQNYQQQYQNGAYDVNYQQGFLAKSKDDDESASDAKSSYDESDEKYFTSECPGFWCPPPYKKCIKNSQKCDGKVDCVGAEDEIGCTYHDSYYSRLANAHGNADQTGAANIFHYEKTRNGTRTEEDAAVTNYAVDPASVTQTSASSPETTTFTAIMPKMPELFGCKRIVQTIPLAKRCDNSFDCEDASDEENCTCKDYLRLNQPSAICNGHVDCFDGSDEQQCEFCNEDQYHCHRSGGCIPKEKRCDQNIDCRLNEDELDCFALTDGGSVNLDMDKRPHLNLEGVLSRYENGAWRASCFKTDFRSEAKRNSAGQKICDYLGFKGLESAHEVVVRTTKLAERQSTKDYQVAYEYPPHFVPAKKSDDKTCYGIHIRCKPVLDRKLNVHLQSDAKSKEQNYLWPWEASIFVDGQYRCSAVLLEHNLLLGSTQCGESIDLSKNYTVAVLGLSSPYIKFNSPYQQASEVVDIRPIKHSDASLFKLKQAVNMTRNVQPLYLEKRIFPASKDDTCVALGVNANHERKMLFLQPIVDNCPKCHRCYIEKEHTSACWVNATMNWSGNVVCLSKNGWYPAAVFHDKDESCGFGSKQILNSIDYLHAHLSEAINEEQEKPHKEPACEGIRGSLGECVPWSRVCDGIRDCQDGTDENPEHCQKMKERCENDVLQCKCGKSELRCNDGKCVPKEMFCDGKTDCVDGSDEPATCNCAEYLKLTRPKLICDGVRNCYDKSDESHEKCLCKDSSFKCYRSLANDTTPCVPEDFVCDGQADCPHGEDESDQTCWAIKPNSPIIKNNGEVMKRTFGILQSVCFPEPMSNPQQVIEICRKVGFSSGVLVSGNTMADSHYVPRNDFYMFQLNSMTWMMMREDKSFGIWRKPESACYKLYVHCF